MKMNIGHTSRMLGMARTVTFVVAGLVGLAATLSSTSVIDQKLRDMRGDILPIRASGNVVLVAIDDKSLHDMDKWPWPRSTHGALLDQLTKSGAATVAFDLDLSNQASDPKQDDLFAQALKRAGRKTLLAATAENTSLKGFWDKYDIATPVLARYSKPASVHFRSDDDQNLRRIAYAENTSNGVIPSMAVAGVGATPQKPGQTILIDSRINPETFPVYSYSDVLAGRVPARLLKGRHVFIGSTAGSMGDFITIPIYHKVPGVYSHLLGAETLLNGEPLWADPLFPTLLGCAAAALALLPRRKRVSIARTVGVMVATVAIQCLIETHTTTRFQVGPALSVLAASLAMQIVWAVAAAFMARIMMAPGTRAPNLNAMRVAGIQPGATSVLRQRNYVETTVMLGMDGQNRLLTEMRRMISEIVPGATIYQVDDHSFAWRCDHTVEEMGMAFDALTGTFGTGVTVDGRLLDIMVAGGVSDETDAGIAPSVATAMLAADAAARRGVAWERYETDGEDEEWRLSILAELDRALDQGDVWVAYQPKHDVKLGRINGCEALIRWNHPERGAVRPDKFIPVVEEAGRIDRLTAYVLDHTLRDFTDRDVATVSVNISMRMLGRGRLVPMVQEAIAKHGFDPKRLTLEVTESADMAGADGIAELEALAAEGINISIDDYGTGKSTLAYLQQMPANELKIDQGFIRPLMTNPRNSTLIDSTVKLAHALGMKVVAEGVENAEIMAALVAMECDVIQGWHTGKPVAIADFPVAAEPGLGDRQRRFRETMAERARRAA